ncbi:major capsid protein P2 [Pseudoduganella aquatica]|uniref:major capsid protein P2 n=1 Tax=Pseudoduganella aquatica TaxID=2660641 RepID=UPI001E551A0C|nr:major capsid protein P2 [Pseudoduganella aquatica]
MWNKPLKQVIGVAAGGVATLELDAESATLVNLKFKLTGTTFNTSHIDRVKVKIGPKTIWDLTGAQLAAINAYKNGAVNTRYLWLDFVERDQANFPVKEIGGIDLMAVLPVGKVTVELTINASAVAPRIDAIGYFEQRQGNTVVVKYMPFTQTQAFAGKQTLNLSFRGAMVKRLLNFYTGTDWTATTDGNVSRIECKKNGVVFFDQNCTDNRFDQSQFKKVPQSRLYVVDYLIDNNHFAQVASMRQLEDKSYMYDSFEINAYLTDPGGTASTVVVEVLDDVTNL